MYDKPPLEVPIKLTKCKIDIGRDRIYSLSLETIRVKWLWVSASLVLWTHHTDYRLQIRGWFITIIVAIHHCNTSQIRVRSCLLRGINHLRVCWNAARSIILGYGCRRDRSTNGIQLFTFDLCNFHTSLWWCSKLVCIFSSHKILREFQKPCLALHNHAFLAPKSHTQLSALLTSL